VYFESDDWLVGGMSSDGGVGGGRHIGIIRLPGARPVRVCEVAAGLCTFLHGQEPILG
jgi:hypothetical protein